MADKLVLIDLSGIAHALFHVHGESPDLNAVSREIIARVRALASGQPHTAICCDSEKSFRREISADYKANRPERDARLYRQLDLAVAQLRSDGFPIWAAEGFEADDVIATATSLGMKGYDWCGRGQRDSPGLTHYDVLIITADKDMLQLVSNFVEVLRPATGTADATTYDAAAVRAKFGVDPHQMLDYLALVGDASDNIKGAEKIGPKTAAKLLNSYGNLDDLYAEMGSPPGVTDVTPAVFNSLLEFRPRLDTVRSLIRLRTDAPIPFDEIFKPRVPADVAVFGAEETMTMDDDIAFGMPTLASAKEAQKTMNALTSRVNETLETGTQEEEPTPLKDSASKLNEAESAESEAYRAHALAMEAARRVAGPQAVAVRAPDVLPAPADWKLQLEPRDMDQAALLAQRMHATGFLGTIGYGTPQAVLMTIMAGREFGMQAMASLRAFHIIDNKPTLSAGAIHAMVLASGKAEYFRCTERTATRATFVTKRRGEPEMVLSFTIEEARQAWSKTSEAWDKSTWGRSPADMLVARCSSKLARLVYPDVIHGLYSTEEFE